MDAKPEEKEKILKKKIMIFTIFLRYFRNWSLVWYPHDLGGGVGMVKAGDGFQSRALLIVGHYLMDIFEIAAHVVTCNF